MGMKIKAFTLAEVLITLGIIGIVAAMTLLELIRDQTFGDMIYFHLRLTTTELYQ